MDSINKINSGKPTSNLLQLRKQQKNIQTSRFFHTNQLKSKILIETPDWTPTPKKLQFWVNLPNDFIKDFIFGNPEFLSKLDTKLKATIFYESTEFTNGEQMFDQLNRS